MQKYQNQEEVDILFERGIKDSHIQVRKKAVTRTSKSPQTPSEDFQNTKGIAEYEALTACIILPTYNEAKNIARLLDKIYDIAQEQKENGMEIMLSVLVVDDNSPDGTAKIVQKYAKENTNVHLLLREKKEGLGAAYIAGMMYAMTHFDPEVILEMDADFSHDPKDIFELLNAIKDGADFAIGSRYVQGGSIPNNWGLHRRAISKVANLYTKIVLRIPYVKDCSGGFRAIKSSLLRRINLHSLHVKGYAFQVLLLEAAIRAGAVVYEVPIEFHERELGTSKMRLHDMIEGSILLLRVGTQRLFTPVKQLSSVNVATANLSMFPRRPFQIKEQYETGSMATEDNKDIWISLQNVQEPAQQINSNNEYREEATSK